MLYNKKLTKSDGELILWHVYERLLRFSETDGALWEASVRAASTVRELLRSFR